MHKCMYTQVHAHKHLHAHADTICTQTDVQWQKHARMSALTHTGLCFWINVHAVLLWLGGNCRTFQTAAVELDKIQLDLSIIIQQTGMLQSSICSPGCVTQVNVLAHWSIWGSRGKWSSNTLAIPMAKAEICKPAAVLHRGGRGYTNQ